MFSHNNRPLEGCLNLRFILSLIGNLIMYLSFQNVFYFIILKSLVPNTNNTICSNPTIYNSVI